MKKLTVVLLILAFLLILAGVVWLYFIILCSYPDACGYWDFDKNFQPSNVTENSIVCQTDNECTFKNKPYCCGNNVEYYKGCYDLSEEPEELDCAVPLNGIAVCPSILEPTRCVCVDNKCVGRN